jgi:GntR family transcriptional regulator
MARSSDPKATTKPLYLTIYETLAHRLTEGEWGIGTSFPSESELSGSLSASRITIRHALRLLENDGFIRKERTKRTVVVAMERQINRRWSIKSIDDIITLVGDAKLNVLSWGHEASPEDAQLLGESSKTPLWCLRSVLTLDNKPFTRSIIYFPPAIGSRLKKRDFNDVIVFRVLKRELGISLHEVGITVWAENACEEDTEQLGCEPGQSLLVTQFRYHDQQKRPVEVAYSRRYGPDARFATLISADQQRA